MATTEPSGAPIAEDTSAPAGAESGAAAPATRGTRWTAPLLALIATLAAIVAAWAWNQAGGVPQGARVVTLGPESPFRGFAISPERPAPTFALTSHEGRPFALEDARGDAVLLFFGFTYCPDVCPTTLATLGAGLEALGDEAERVTVLLVSVDPERDSPERLAEYLAGFSTLDGHVVGLTGTLDEIRAVAGKYGVFFEKEGLDGGPPPETGYTVAHSTSVFLIDHHGALRASFSQHSPEDVAHDVRYVLENG